MSLGLSFEVLTRNMTATTASASARLSELVQTASPKFADALNR